MLKVGPLSLYEDSDEFSYDFPDFSTGQRTVTKEGEERLLLSDVFDPQGRLYSTVARNGQILPLVYVYDFGVGCGFILSRSS